MNRLAIFLIVVVLLLSDVSCQKRRNRKRKKATTPPPPKETTFQTTSGTTSFMTTTGTEATPTQTEGIKVVTTENSEVVTDRVDLTTEDRVDLTTEGGGIQEITTDWSKVNQTTQSGTTKPPTTEAGLKTTDSDSTTADKVATTEKETMGTSSGPSTGTTSGPSTGTTESAEIEDLEGTTFYTTAEGNTGPTEEFTGTPNTDFSTTFFSGETTSWLTTTEHIPTEAKTTQPISTPTNRFVSTPEPTEAVYNFCPKHTYACKKRQKCIGRGHVCNGKWDCPGGDDEEGCSKKTDKLLLATAEPLSCKSDEFSCKIDGVGKCLHEILKCDGKHDCDKGADEENCAGKLRCAFDHWPCDDGLRCYAKTEWCNGVRNCKDNSDESKCKKEKCPLGDWQCKNGDCIPDVFRCDGFPDCDDHSDERPKMCETF